MNDSTQPPIHNGAETDIMHKPFTPGERIQQLSDVDNDIASLLVHLSGAMRALATPPGTEVPQPPTATTTNNKNDNTPSDIPIPDADAEPEAQAEAGTEPTDPVSAFQRAQSAFFQTVDRIDKQLTRQILALEEAGIITLRNTADQQPQQADQQGSFSGGQPLLQLQQQQQQGGVGAELRRAKDAGPARLEPDGVGRYGALEVGQLNLASSTVERDMEAELWRRAREEMGKIMGVGEGGQGEMMEE